MTVNKHVLALFIVTTTLLAAGSDSVQREEASFLAQFRTALEAKDSSSVRQFVYQDGIEPESVDNIVDYLIEFVGPDEIEAVSLEPLPDDFNVSADGLPEKHYRPTPSKLLVITFERREHGSFVTQRGIERAVGISDGRIYLCVAKDQD